VINHMNLNMKYLNLKLKLFILISINNYAFS